MYHYVIMNQAILSIRINADDKKELPFMIRSESFNEEIERKLLEVEKEMEKNPKKYAMEEVIESMKKIVTE